MARQINYPSVRHLVCVAGPPCSGKTYAMQGLQNGTNQRLAEILGISSPEEWPAFAPGWLPPDCSEHLDHALFHYDFLRVWKFGGLGGQFDKDPVLEVLDKCETVDFVTLLTSSEQLRIRLSARSVSQMVRKTGRRPGSLINLMLCLVRVRKLYRNPQSLARIYDDWLEYACRFPSSSHVVIDSSGEYTRVDRQDMMQVLTDSAEIKEAVLV